MSNEIFIALLAGVVAIISAFISIFGQTRSKRVEYQLSKIRGQEEIAAQESKQINSKYLNPLRQHLVECYFRLREISNHIQNNKGKHEALLYVSEEQEVSGKPFEWFYGEGCYLISSCYLTACLFNQFTTAKSDIPYLRLSKGDDTVLINKVIKVQQAFLHHLGIFYVVQSSIGHDIMMYDQNRIMSYREFCQILQIPEKRIWFDRLIHFYINFGKGKHLDRLDMALQSMKDLSEFLDDAVGGGDSLKVRIEIEG